MAKVAGNIFIGAADETKLAVGEIIYTALDVCDLTSQTRSLLS